VKLLCKHYGLKKASNPIIFAKTGRPVGTVDDFIKLAHDKFGIDASKLTNPIDASVNEKIARDDYQERHRDRTLLEKIEDKYETLLANGKIPKLKGYYESQVDKGVEYFVKKTDTLSPFIDIPLTVPYNYVKDAPYEDFEADFTAGAMKQDRLNASANEAGRGTGELKKQGTMAEVVKHAEEEKSVLDKVLDDKQLEDPSSNLLTNASQVQGQTLAQIQQNQDTDLPAPTEGVNKSLVKSQVDQNKSLNKSQIDQNKSLNRSQLDQSVNIGDKSLEKTNESLNQSALNESRLERIRQNGSELVLLNSFIVEDLGDNYYLSFHPNPLYEGQCVLFNDNYEQYKEKFGLPEGVEEEDGPQIGLIDYSLVERKENSKPVGENPSVLRSKLKAEDSKTLINKAEISLYDPLTGQDWLKAYKVVSETDSIAFLQLLPVGQRNFRALANGVINIVPRKFLLQEYKNFGISPQSNVQDQALPFEKAFSKAIEDNSKKPKFAGGHTDETLALGSLPFKHRLAPVDPKGDALAFKQLYIGLVQKLTNDYKNIEKLGINIVLSSKWLLVAPLTSPYLVQKTTPIYLDPLAWIGYVAVPELKHVWPQTGKLELNVEKWTPSQVLGHCSSQ